MGKTKYDWESIRKDYETSTDSFAAIARRNGLSNAGFMRNYAKKHHWISPRDIDKQARKKALKSQEAIIDKTADHYVKEWEKGRDKAIEIANKALEDYASAQKDGEKTPKDMHELAKAVQVFKDACGVSENTGPKIGLNLQLLASPMIVDDSFVEV